MPIDAACYPRYKIFMFFQQKNDREKDKVGGRPAKLNEKKGDIDLEREIKKKGYIFCWKNNMKIL